MTLANILFLHPGDRVSGLATLGVLFAGLIGMARKGPVEQRRARQAAATSFMWWRVRLQILTHGDDPAVVPCKPRAEPMVKLTRIYTQAAATRGKTSLGRGERVAKHDPRVEAYGTVDEANSP